MIWKTFSIELLTMLFTIFDQCINEIKQYIKYSKLKWNCSDYAHIMFYFLDLKSVDSTVTPPARIGTQDTISESLSIHILVHVFSIQSKHHEPFSFAKMFRWLLPFEICIMRWRLFSVYIKQNFCITNAQWLLNCL